MNELVIAFSVAVISAAGLYQALSRDLVSIVIGLALLGSAANLFVFATGRLDSAIPPIISPGMEAVAGVVSDPLPQALVLTAIVIGFAFACFSIALVLAINGSTGLTDADALQRAEPAPRESGEPGDLP
jgi:multicomponent Na+:H+ antiporter subunit C